MKKIVFVFSIINFIYFSHASAFFWFHDDLTNTIPKIEVSNPDFEKIPDVTQYGESDWSQVIGIARNISLRDAYDIASKNPKITYFFYMKGNKITLETKKGGYRTFYYEDAVFFGGTPMWGCASSLADGYIKK